MQRVYFQTVFVCERWMTCFPCAFPWARWAFAVGRRSGDIRSAPRTHTLSQAPQASMCHSGMGMGLTVSLILQMNKRVYTLSNHVKMLCFCFASLSPGLICCFTLLSGWRRKQELRLILDHNIQGNSKKGTHIRNHESWIFKKTYSSSKTPASSIANKLFFFFFDWQIFCYDTIH